MPTEVKWADPEKTILLETINGEWTLADVFTLMETASKMITEVSHKVDIIADLTNARFSDANLLHTLSRLQRLQPSNTGRVVVVKANAYLKALTNVASQLAPKTIANIQFVNTIEEAYAILGKDKDSKA